MIKYMRCNLGVHQNVKFWAYFGVIVIFGMVVMISETVAADKTEIHAALTDNAKKIVAATNAAFGGELEPVCVAGRTNVNPKVRLITKDLIKQKLLVGPSGFFQLEVENYYARVCGKRFRRKK